MNKTHLTPLGKLVAFVLMITIGAVAGAAGASAVRPHASEWRCVEVGPGDTLWEIAGSRGDGDPRAVLHKIVRHNDLAGATLEPGMGIWVPRLAGEADETEAVCPEP